MIATASSRNELYSIVSSSDPFNYKLLHNKTFSYYLTNITLPEYRIRFIFEECINWFDKIISSIYFDLFQSRYFTKSIHKMMGIKKAIIDNQLYDGLQILRRWIQKKIYDRFCLWVLSFIISKIYMVILMWFASLHKSNY